MKQLEALKMADKHWVRKCKGYRVHCRQIVDEIRQDVLMPSEGSLLMESDVVGWRLAHRLSTAPGEAVDGLAMFTDIYVIDDLGERISYYKIGKLTVLNPES